MDYRDTLRLMLEGANEGGLTKAAICRALGVHSGTLVNVLAKRRHFSLPMLEKLLEILGCEIVIKPKEIL